jgi:MYXO-CTERM domain-containing protein
VERRSWSPVIIVGVMLGAGLGALLALILIRRRRRDEGTGLAELPWRDLLTLIGPIVMLARRLIEISRRQMIELEKR